MKRKQNIALFLLVSLALCLLPSQIFGWVTIGPDWAGDDTTMSLNYGSTWNPGAEDALFRWNDIGASSFDFFFNNSNHDHCDRGTACIGTDGNACEWDDFSNGDCDGSPSTALAVTKLNWLIDFCNADVLFNNQYSWTTSARDWTTNSPFEFNTVAIHEFGHALGLDHENRWVATMNCIYHANFRGIHGDDRAGCRNIYPSGSQTDISVTNWVKTDNSCNTAAGLVTGPTSATSGNNVTVQTVMENKGTTAINNLMIRWYLSTNDIISTGDTLLGTNTGASINGPGTITFNRTLTIPSSTSSGTYWIGVIMDPLNTIAESNENNNALEQPRSITITCPSISTPTSVAATDGTWTDRVRVTWNSVSGASNYSIYRNTINSSTGRVLIATDSASPYDNTSATPGVTYYYWVRANRSCGSTSGYSSTNSGWRALVSPTPTATDGTWTSRVRVTWPTVSGASHYRVYRSTTNSSGTATALSSWQAGTLFDDLTAVPLQTYYYWVRAATSSSGTRASAFGTSNSGWRDADCDNPPTWDYLITPTTSWLTTPTRSYIEHGCHIYRMYLEAHKSYNFSLCANDAVGATYTGTGDGDMTMYNWQGSFLWSLNGESDCGFDATTLGSTRENWRPPSDGYYYLRVYDRLDDPASYKLAYRCICADPEAPTTPNPAEENAAVPEDIILSWGNQCVTIDDFNRSDNTNMGPKWIERSGDTSVESFLANALVSTSLMTYEDGSTGNHICADVYHSGSNLQYAALVSGYSSVTNHVFIKFQGSGLFNGLGFYFGNNGNNNGAWSDSGFITIPAFEAARVSTHLVGDRIIVEIDTNWDGIPDQVHERGNLPMQLLGDGTGLGFWGVPSPWVDNFGVLPSAELPVAPLAPLGVADSASVAAAYDPTQNPDYTDPAPLVTNESAEIQIAAGEPGSEFPDATEATAAEETVVFNPDMEGGNWIGAGQAPTEAAPSLFTEGSADLNSAALSAGGVLIDFDDATQPCSFSSATRLTTAYSALGITFQGPGGNDGGAILDECGGFGVSGHSSPNFLAFNPPLTMNDGGNPTAPETLLFSSPVRYVHAKVGTGAGTSGTVYMRAYNSYDLLVDTDTRFMSATMSSLAVEGHDIVRVEITTTSTSYWVLDDLFFTDACMDLGHLTIAPATYANLGNTDRSAAVAVDETITVTSLGIKASIGIVTNLAVTIREVTGATRGQVLATASMPVTPGAQQFHKVPIAFQFRPGIIYDIGFDVGGGWEFDVHDMELYSFQNSLLDPAVGYKIGPFNMIDGGSGGSYSNSLIPHIVACTDDVCPTTYDVYLDTSNPPTTLLCSDVSDPYCPTAAPLSPCEIYYWRVVARNCCGSQSGPVWSFSTDHLLDFTHDDIVDYVDYSVMAENYGASCGPSDWCSHADVTKNGAVNLLDLWYLSYYWLDQCP